MQRSVKQMASSNNSQMDGVRLAAGRPRGGDNQSSAALMIATARMQMNNPLSANRPTVSTVHTCVRTPTQAETHVHARHTHTKWMTGGEAVGSGCG